MSDETVVRLVGIAQEDAGRELPAPAAMGADRRPADRSTEQECVRADPQRSFESRARAHLHAALQHYRPLTYIEDHAGFQGGVVHRDARGVAQHEAACREGIAVAQARAQVFRELPVEPRTRSYVPRSTAPATSTLVAWACGPSQVAPVPTPHPTVTPWQLRRNAAAGRGGARPRGTNVDDPINAGPDTGCRALTAGTPGSTNPAR